METISILNLELLINIIKLIELFHIEFLDKSTSMRSNIRLNYFALGVVSASVCLFLPHFISNIFWDKSNLGKRINKKGRKLAVVFGDSITQQG